MPSQYLLRVNSRPIKASSDVWEKWYVEEHLPDLVNSGTAVRAAFYRSTHDLGGLSTASKIPPDEKKFLAMYQTEFPACLETDQYQKCRKTSEMLPGGKVPESAEWDVRNYEMIEDYDPKKIGDVPSPFILNVCIEPKDDVDYNAWYSEEHLYMLAKVPGYRRSQRYKLGKADGRTPEDAPRFIAVHEFDTLEHLDGPELREADASPWTLKNLREAKMVDVRGFRLLTSLGY